MPYSLCFYRMQFSDSEYIHEMIQSLPLINSKISLTPSKKLYTLAVPPTHPSPPFHSLSAAYLQLLTTTNLCSISEELTTPEHFK